METKKVLVFGGSGFIGGYVANELQNRGYNIIDLELKMNIQHYHYELTPYSFQPISSKKLIANPYIDMGQGLLECVKNISIEISN